MSAMPPSAPPSAPSSDRTIMLVLSYLGILALIPLLTKKDDPEVQWHAKNGLCFAVAFFVVFFIFMIVGFVPFLHLLVFPLECIIWLGFIVVTIMAIMKALNGQRFRLPVVSDFADKF
jgi:uncharacterized membrane protein